MTFGVVAKTRGHFEIRTTLNWTQPRALFAPARVLCGASGRLRGALEVKLTPVSKLTPQYCTNKTNTVSITPAWTFINTLVKFSK